MAKERAIKLGDLYGDGTLDVVVATYYPSAVSVLLGKGGGTFAAPASRRPMNTRPQSNSPTLMAIGSWTVSPEWQQTRLGASAGAG